MKPAGIIVVADDEPGVVRLLQTLLERDNYTVHAASDGEAALDLVRTHLPDVVLSDVMMPKLTGFELCRRIKAERATRLTPVVLITGLGYSDHRFQGIDAGADDFLTKPVNAEELRARVRSLVRLKRYTDDLDSAESVILNLALIVEARDPYTHGHCVRVAAFAAALGIQLDLPDEDITTLHRGGYLHDVGKIGVPDAVLLKPGPLLAGERQVMETHASIGDALCGDLRLLRAVRPIVRHHHERLDGTGYPDRLSGDAVPLLAQIVGIVDGYDAMTTARSYRPARSVDAAYRELAEEAARGWRSARLVDEFLMIARSGRLQRTADTGPNLVLFPERTASSPPHRAA